ncbi:hypothetical protein F511_29573 [Dorcoceras hygrometricum]|uniref:Uncharacterized protein n=1 Tax=Dorcoceras hygrometricum TaxID=472368 RepID=A0A2Z7C3V6_9LAMI|nr:hypothetical protein F511_29573 [Dorcoceras hygrometricum]
MFQQLQRKRRLTEVEESVKQQAVGTNDLVEADVNAGQHSCSTKKSWSVINPAVACFGVRILNAIVLSESWFHLCQARAVEADVNAGQHSCSTKRKRRRLDVAAGCPAARDLCATVARVWFPVACCWYCARASNWMTFIPGCEGERRYHTLISLLGSLATMRRVVNYHSSWARQRQVELFDASGIRFDLMSLWGLVRFLVCVVSENPGFTAGRGFNPAGGAPGGV